jgi:hypothetical protein
MKNSDLVFDEDSLLINEKSYASRGKVVMDRSETSLMKRYSEIITKNGGDILECGFGMGISADFIYNSNITSYTCIEINESVYNSALEWAKDKPNAKIILGNWVDVIPTLTVKFDGIFHDTHLDHDFMLFEEYCEQIAKPNCILSIFGYHFYPKSDRLENEVFIMDKPLKHLNMRTNHWKIIYSYFINGSFSSKQKTNINLL